MRPWSPPIATKTSGSEDACPLDATFSNPRLVANTSLFWTLESHFGRASELELVPHSGIGILLTVCANASHGVRP